MKGETELDHLLSQMVDELSKPLSDEDRRDGWTADALNLWRLEFGRLQQELGRGREPRNWWNIMRGFEDGGYPLGRLADKARRIQRRFQNLYGH